MQLLAKLSATALFLQEVINRPRQIGAIVPSSNNLATAMARWLPADRNAFVLELGPGTGAVTKALLKRGLPEERLVAIEKSPKLADHLRQQFPRAHVITGDALDLDELLARRVGKATRVSMVVSSLPLLMFDPESAEHLARKIGHVLRPNGKLVQYSYHLGLKRTGALARFRCLSSKIIWLNVPPARVSVYQESKPASADGVGFGRTVAAHTFARSRSFNSPS
ncbi:MAG: class I SAM-dependent methyltransferase [Limisphaerales bacterium]